MSNVTSPSSDKTGGKRQEAFEDDSHEQAKRPRAGEDIRIPRRDALSNPLAQKRYCRVSQDSIRGSVGNRTNMHRSLVEAQHSKDQLTNQHARVYVGNLPKHLAIPSAAYKELFLALYVTAFGALKPGEALPVQQFWLHSCKKYGFLRMRGSKQAVNILLFNGLELHGRKIKLNRPTGYRPDIKNLSADEYVPDRVSGKRMEVLIKALCGIISAPRERSYLVALERSKEEKELDILEKVSTSGSDNPEGDIEIIRVEGDIEEEQNSSKSRDKGT